MRKLQITTPADEVFVATEVFALALPPPTYGLVPAAWAEHDMGGASIPEVDFEIWSNATINLTGAELFGGSLHERLFADLTVTAVDAGANNVTSVGHAMLTGDGPVRHTSAGAVVGGLAVDTDYWVIKDDADKFGLADSLAHALAGTRLDLTGAGSGVRKIVAVDTVDANGRPLVSARVYWHSHGLLGPAEDGAIALTADRGYLCTRPHRNRVVAYAVTATFSTSDPEWVSISMWPSQDR